ncbi:unnamed protein product, partial [Mesorhabditis belari]|uniref:Uncharacterized protein n=1 Tax=Mesorhabditis belari TaxID=2138241 RepID=A0AAF3FN38_9BILA
MFTRRTGVVRETFCLRPPRSKLGQAGFKNMTLLNFVQNLRDRDMVLDYKFVTLLAQFRIVVNDGAIAMLAAGVAPRFLHQSVCTRFLVGSQCMVEFVATDYIANSLLYQRLQSKSSTYLVEKRARSPSSTWSDQHVCGPSNATQQKQ